MQVLDTTTGEIFDSVAEAAEQTENEAIAIKSCCEQYRLTDKKLIHFVYLEDYIT